MFNQNDFLLLKKHISDWIWNEQTWFAIHLNNHSKKLKHNVLGWISVWRRHLQKEATTLESQQSPASKPVSLLSPRPAGHPDVLELQEIISYQEASKRRIKYGSSLKVKTHIQNHLIVSVIHFIKQTRQRAVLVPHFLQQLWWEWQQRRQAGACSSPSVTWRANIWGRRAGWEVEARELNSDIIHNRRIMLMMPAEFSPTHPLSSHSSMAVSASTLSSSHTASGKKSSVKDWTKRCRRMWSKALVSSCKTEKVAVTFARWRWSAVLSWIVWWLVGWMDSYLRFQRQATVEENEWHSNVRYCDLWL